jgi:two-component system, response regulator / RNA-binding antiterminator
MNILKVLLIEDDQNNALLENSLQGAGINFLKIPYSDTFLALLKEIKPDAIVLGIDFPSEKMLVDLLTLNQQFPLPVVMFTQDDNIDTIKRAMQADVAAYILDGLVPQRLLSILQVAMARFKQQQLLKNALEDARAKLEDRKKIDHAKAILIKTQKFSEDEAYHTLRKLAMDRNITLGEMAKNVIAMAELLK